MRTDFLTRCLPHKRQPVAQIKPAVHFSIDQFVIFSGMLKATGWIHNEHSTLVSLRLKTETTTFSLDRIRLESPDVAAAMGRSAGYARFEGRWLTSVPAAILVNAILVATFKDGSTFEIDRLGARGVSSEAPARLINSFIGAMRERPSGTLLEVGSRARSGITRRNFLPATWHYMGMDILPGENVDVVGDAHRLSSLFPTARFDAVMSFSVLEHLLMPWKFVIELNQVLNIGGIGLFCTHQTWPMHDQPWDFWRFSREAWSALLNEATGFEIIEACVGEPAYVVANRCHAATNFADHPDGFLASSVMFRKIGDTRLAWNVEVDDIISNAYPSHTTEAHV